MIGAPERGTLEGSPLTTEEWRTAARRAVVFGHQSVGDNLLEGVRALAAEKGVAYPVVESRDPGTRAGVVHFRVGRNEDPSSKLADFARVIDSGVGADLAMMKLCYVDFTDGTDARALAEAYLVGLERLQGAHPGIRFAAVTAPLTTPQGGPKALVKKLLGRTPAGYEVNLRRWEFNETLRARLGRKGLVFDLARAESAGAGFEHGGQRVEALHPALTSDGGHLNAEGQRRVASAFVRFVATAGD